MEGQGNQQRYKSQSIRDISTQRTAIQLGISTQRSAIQLGNLDVKRRYERKLSVFEMSCLRKIKGVTRRDRIHSIDIKDELGFKLNLVSGYKEDDFSTLGM